MFASTIAVLIVSTSIFNFSCRDDVSIKECVQDEIEYTYPNSKR